MSRSSASSWLFLVLLHTASRWSLLFKILTTVCLLMLPNSHVSRNHWKYPTAMGHTKLYVPESLHNLYLTKLDQRNSTGNLFLPLLLTHQLWQIQKNIGLVVLHPDFAQTHICFWGFWNDYWFTCGFMGIALKFPYDSRVA